MRLVSLLAQLILALTRLPAVLWFANAAVTPLPLLR